MADPENLNRSRKEKRRAEARQQAKENRIRFGRTGAGKARDQILARRLQRDHEGSRLIPDEDK